MSSQQSVYSLNALLCGCITLVQVRERLHAQRMSREKGDSIMPIGRDEILRAKP